MTQDFKIKDLVQRQFPQIFREDSQNLIRFIEFYYEWLQKEGNALDVLRKINYYRDIDKVPEKFYTFLRGEFLKNLPQGLAVDEKILYKNILDFYRSKGSENSFKLLFKLLYNEDISFYYPAEDILRGSDGRWVVDKTLRINPNILQEEFKDFYTFYGETSGASARFEKLVASIIDNFEVFDIYVSHVDGEFEEGERLLVDGLDVHIGIVVGDGVTSQEGHYEGTYGFLSADKYLQDNFYYQEYSYVIKSTKAVGQYQDIVKQTIHPAGLKMFGAIEMESILDLGVNAYTNLGMETLITIGMERVIEYDWDAAFDFSSSFGVVSRESTIDYWENKKFTNTSYKMIVEGVSFNENSISYFDNSRNTIRNDDFTQYDIEVGDYVAVYKNVNTSYFYDVRDIIGRTRIIVNPRLSGYELYNGLMRVVKNNPEEIPFTEIITKKRDDKFIRVGQPVYDNILEYLNEPIVNLFNININDFASGRLFRSEYEQNGILADQRVYTVRDYSDSVVERALANENMDIITNENDIGVLLDTYAVDKKHKIIVKQLSKKYSIFSDNIDVTGYDYSNDTDFQSNDNQLFIEVNALEEILLDEHGNALCDHSDFIFASFA